MKKWLVCVVFLCILDAAYAAQTPVATPVKQTIQTDTSNVKVRSISPEKINEYLDNDDFSYHDTPRQQLSLWDRFWLWFWSLINKLFAEGTSNKNLKPLFIVLGAAAVAFILFKLLKSEKIFVSGGKRNILNYDVIPDDIHAINYEAEIAAAAAENKFRLAIRLLYLRSLKQLSDAELIAWQPNKTNFAYVNEIKTATLQQPFKLLTLQFDYIWYGHFTVNEQEFTPIHQSFNEFSTMIK